METPDITNFESNWDVITKLQNIIEKHKDKRIVVVWTTCTGKSTFVMNIKDSLDMDDIIFPLLSEDEKNYVCQSPWTQDIWDTMNNLVKQRIKTKIWQPLFGTVIVDSDLIVYLKINDDLLRQRTASRNASFTDAKQMQKQIEQQIQNSWIHTIQVNL